LLGSGGCQESTQFASAVKEGVLIDGVGTCRVSEVFCALQVAAHHAEVVHGELLQTAQDCLSHAARSQDDQRSVVGVEDGLQMLHRKPGEVASEARQVGLMADLFTQLQRLFEQQAEAGSQPAPLARRLVGLPDLAKNLILADGQRLQRRSDAQEVSHRCETVHSAQCRRTGQQLVQAAQQRVEVPTRGGGGEQFEAIAGLQHDQFSAGKL
jgi:hypothetical protein